MLQSTPLSTLAVLLAATRVYAGCSIHSFTSCADGIVHWYDPNTGEVCDPLDCGGGRAPAKTDVPGCPLYSGTEVRTTSYLSCFTTSSAATLSSTGSTPSSSAQQPTQSIVTSASASAPVTTSPPSISTSTTGGVFTSTSTPNTGGRLDGPWAMVAGVVVGAAILV